MWSVCPWISHQRQMIQTKSPTSCYCCVTHNQNKFKIKSTQKFDHAVCTPQLLRSPTASKQVSDGGGAPLYAHQPTIRYRDYFKWGCTRPAGLQCSVTGVGKNRDRQQTASGQMSHNDPLDRVAIGWSVCNEPSWLVSKFPAVLESQGPLLLA